MKPHYKALSSDEGIDRIEIVAVPRYKTSGLFGDEWRMSATTRFYRKGRLVGEQSYPGLKVAASFLPGNCQQLPELCQGPLWGYDGTICMQPSCSEPATVVYRLKEEYSSHGQGPLPKSPLERRRAFCGIHGMRGDCSREDADRNYEALDGEHDE